MRCEGWRRYGGAFSVGGVPKWQQCKDAATVVLKVKQSDGVQELPACPKCWEEAIGNKDIEILSAAPLAKEERS